jgi:hypothetical protein
MSRSPVRLLPWVCVLSTWAILAHATYDAGQRCCEVHSSSVGIDSQLSHRARDSRRRSVERGRG